MANHGYVTTKKPLDHKKITEIFQELNTKLFKGCIQIEYDYDTDPKRWGDHTWILKVVVDDMEYAQRLCWIENAYQFEMRHGGGGSFAWWLGLSMLNAVALEFDGIISDDGDSRFSSGQPDLYPTFQDYFEKVNPRIIPEHRAKLLKLEEDQLVPPAFRSNNG